MYSLFSGSCSAKSNHLNFNGNPNNDSDLSFLNTCTVMTNYQPICYHVTTTGKLFKDMHLSYSYISIGSGYGNIARCYG